MNNSLNAKKIKQTLMVVLMILAADQATKFMILQHLTTGSTLPVIPGLFNLVLTFNRGVAFGFMSGYPETLRLVLLTVTALTAFGAIIYFFLYEYSHDYFAQLALAMIFGGALGNIIDRVRIGMVVDFLDFYIGQSHWPAFNIADSAICVGVAVLLFRRPKKDSINAGLAG